VTVRFAGVKTTLNKLAVKLELSWHVLRDEVSISCSAETPEKRARTAVKTIHGESIKKCMIEDSGCLFLSKGIDLEKSWLLATGLNLHARLMTVSIVYLQCSNILLMAALKNNSVVDK
jgi:hypothetical protein